MEPNTTELEFRDGKRLVPTYLADLMAGIETFRYSFEEAREMANRRLASDFLGRVQRRIVGDSLREGGSQ